MMTRSRSCLPLVSVLLLLAAFRGVARADCASDVLAFRAALTSRSLEAVRETEYALSSDAACASDAASARDQLEAFEVALATDASVPEAIREDALTDVAANGHSWTTAVALADDLLARHKALEASGLYDRAIALAAKMGGLSDADRTTLIAKAGAAKMLASDDAEGRKRPVFARSLRGVHGGVGGVYSITLRGLARVRVPLPINFIKGTTDYTPVGQAAVAELVEALKQQKPAAITFIGHTDPSGSDAYNMQLSERRARRVAETVRDALARDHLSIRIDLIAKGKSEPFDVSRLPIQPTEDERYALDRRVEFER